ncbi:MAG: TCP-1/cpn60 chaperonin family protein, partial [Candidatus Brocadiia bacterium]
HRVEDAVHATRAAVEEGIVPGGGVALLRACVALDGLEVDGDEAIGVDIVRRALRRPLMQIAENAGKDGAVVLQEVLGKKKISYGYDAAKDEYCDLVKRGVIDPTKVVRTALQNGASVASVLVSTDAVVGELPEKKKKQPAMPEY